MQWKNKSAKRQVQTAISGRSALGVRLLVGLVHALVVVKPESTTIYLVHALLYHRPVAPLVFREEFLAEVVVGSGGESMWKQFAPFILLLE